ncbi:MAG TPA: hypothetical protein VI700_06535, partial [Thermoanaerobaculaceae bacterium]|nr:hypothetical protein [Thermoanaerobaculaceae bacterium]
MRVSTVAAATVALLALPIAAQQPTPSPAIRSVRTFDLQRAALKPALAGQLTVDQVKGKNGYGPGFAVPLGDRVTVAQLAEFSLETRDLCRLSLSVYPDANPATGIFYYRPKRYALRFDPQDGYFMTVDYKGSTTEGKNVLVQARLTPGAGTN